MSLVEASAELSTLFQNKKVDWGSVWVMLMRRVCQVFDSRDGARPGTNMSSRSAFDIHFRGNLVAWAVQWLSSLSDAEMEQLWAAPGMASFLLSSVDMTSDYMRQKKEEGTTLSDDALCSYRYDPVIHTHFGLASFFCVWIFASTMEKNPSPVGDIATRNVPEPPPVA